jgi:D-aminopeptidase
VKILLNTDLEGCAGIFHRELQITSAAPHEFARTLRMCTGEVVAAIEGATTAGAQEVLVHAIHDIDPEMLPAGIQFIRGASPWDMSYLEKDSFDALIIIGQHGGGHLLNCALSHTFLPSWQLEGSTGLQEGWIKQVAPQLAGSSPGEFSTVEKVWLNGRLAGETSFIMTMAAAFGVPTACVSGCIHACEEARELATKVDLAPVKWCIDFRAAQMLSPTGARKVIRAQVESALKRLDKTSGLAAALEPQEIKIRYVHPERADRAAKWPGSRRLDEHTIAATAPSGRDLSALRFLFARPAGPAEAPTALENYEPPDWLKQSQ